MSPLLAHSGHADRLPSCPLLRVDRLPAGSESQLLHVALDNMPGALVYTDEDLNIVICNDRFKEMYPAPGELLQSSRPYPDFLRFLAENGATLAPQWRSAWRVCGIRPSNNLHLVNPWL